MPPFKGFTLIELLIMLVIISIVAGVALVSIQVNHEKEIQKLGVKITRLLTLAEEDALLRPAVIGLGVRENTLQFYTYEMDTETQQYHWALIKKGMLSPHVIPSYLELVLKMDDIIQPFSLAPQIIISSTGELTAFTILIAKKNKLPSYQVIGKASGEVLGSEISA